MAEDSRAVRILSDLCGVLRREKNIHEFGFVYCPEPLYNKSPIVVVDRNLGIETWSIKLLYSYAYSQLFHCNERHHDLKRVSDCSMAVLLLNPECLSAWNLRKQLVLKKYLKPDEELTFAQLVLSKHPKSPDTFCQRRWLLLQLFSAARSAANGTTPSTSQASQEAGRADPRPAAWAQEARGNDPEPQEDGALMTRVQTEVDVCSLAASRYPSNYNAWSHRIWVVKNLAGNPQPFLRAELAGTKSWVSLHLSDHSGFHYRQFLLRALTELSPRTSPGSDSGLAGDAVLEELQLILDLVTAYPGHEAVWCHRRFVVYLWKTLLCNGIRMESDPNSPENTCHTNSCNLLKPSSENESIRDHPAGASAVPLLGKRPSEHQQIGNQPLGKRPSEDRPVGSENPGHRPSGNRPSENGHHLEAEGDPGCARTPSANQPGGVDPERDTPFSAMQPSTCSHDASLLHHYEQHVSPAALPRQKPIPAGTASQTTHRGASYAVDATSPSTELRRLMQHERRFVDIAVGDTASAEDTAQKRCAENYWRWLENLQ